MEKTYLYGGVLKTRYKDLEIYINNNKILQIKTKCDINEKDDEYIIKIIKTSYKRQFKQDFSSFLNYCGFNIKKCKFCGDIAKYNIKIIRNSNIINILNIEYNYIKYNEKIYEKIYCHNKNKNCIGSTLNPNSVEFVSTIYSLSNNDALNYIKQRNKSPFYKENFESDDEYIKSQSRNLSYYISKYGKINGTKKYNNYRKKLKYSHNEQYYIDKMGVDDGKKHWQYLSQLKDSVSYKYFLKKCNGDEILAKKMYDERLLGVSLTLNGFINRHGEIEGEKKYNQYKKENSILSPLRIYNVSKSSIYFFNTITDILLKENIIIDKNEVQYGIQNEKAIYNEITHTCYFYDFLLKNHKIIIEYNGIAFHPKTIDDKKFKHAYDKINSVDFFYNRDQHKINTAIKYGYNVIIIWEDDKQKIQNCIKLIKEIIK